MTKPTYDDHVGDGSNKNFGYTYPILKTEDVKVSVDGVTQTSGYTVNESNTRVEFTTAPANQAKVRVYRETAVGKSNGDEDPKAVFAAGSAIRARDLNANQEQALFGIQELQDKQIQTEDIVDDAITSAKILDGTITNANLNASAAIAGSKVAPTFGAQNISTSGTLAAGATTVTGNITVSGTVDGRDVAADGSKLDGIEVGAKDDQTAAEIRALVESASDSNVFTDTDHTKLNNIADNANNYVHPTSAGNKHIPSGGSSGQFLKYDSSGTAVWAADNDTTYSVGDGGLTQKNFTTTLKDKLDGIEASATADQTGAEIKTAYEANSNTNAYVDTHNTLVGGITATASELNKLDGVTASTTDLNQVTGLAKQTTITDDDDKFPTSGAVVDYVAAQLDPVGGFEVIATDAAFPNTQPASGVVISIADAGGLVVNGSGVSTTGRTVGGSTVTINNINSQFNSSTITNGVAMMVSSTGSSQTYNYHKATLREQDITSISTDIEDFGNRYRVGSSNPTSNNDDGDLFFNTTSNKMVVWNASANNNNGAWEEVQSVGNFYINTISSYSGTGGNSATFNGSAYRFVLSNAPTYAQQLIVSVNGVIQKPNAGTSQPSEGFVIDGSSIIFSSAPPSGADYFIITIGASVNIGAPSNDTVGADAMIDGAIVNAAVNTNANIAGSKLADDSIAEVKLDIHNAPSGTDKFLKYTSNGMEWVVPSYTTNTTIGGTTGADFNDNIKLRFGTGNDLQIYASGNNSVITHSGDGDLHIEVTGSGEDLYLNANDDIYIRTTTNENAIKCIGDGAVELYYDNAKTFETVSGGSKVTGNLEVTGNITLGDSDRVWFGADSDAYIMHDNAHLYFTNMKNNTYVSAANYVNIVSTDTNGSNTETSATFLRNGAVELYYDNALKFETTSSGAKTHGLLGIRGAEGAAAILELVSDEGDDHADNWRMVADTDHVFYFQNYAGGGWENNIKAFGNGAVELYYDNTKRLETNNYGAKVNGHLYLDDSHKVNLGSSQDLEIYHDATNSWIDNGTGNLLIRDNTGDIYLQAPVVSLQGGTSESNKQTAKFTAGGAVELYHNDAKKLETTSGGISVTGNVGASNDLEITSDSGKIKLGADSDLQIFHDGSHGYLKNTTGDFYFQGTTGENHIIMNPNAGVKLLYDDSIKLQTTSAGGTLTGTWTGAGKILQVVTAYSTSGASTTDNWDTSNDKGTNLGPTLSITPSSTSSKIIISWSGGVFLGGGNQGNKIGMIGLWNETTDTMVSMGRVGANLSNSSDDFGQHVTIAGWDSPSSTDAQVYTLQAGRYSGTYDNTIEINPDSGFGPRTNMYAMEVSG